MFITEKNSRITKQKSGLSQQKSGLSQQKSGLFILFFLSNDGFNIE